MTTNRYVDLWLSDFAADPYEFAATLPVTPTLLTRKGDLVGTRRLPARRNLVIVRHEVGIGHTWDHAVGTLMQKLGGWGAVERLVIDLAPSEAMVQFTLPINGSPHQENNFLTAATLSQLGRLRLDLGFEFGSHDPGEQACSEQPGSNDQTAD